MTTVSAELFCNKLREYIDTPFVHAGRNKGVQGGVDCGGLIIKALEELGFEIDDITSYPTGDRLQNIVTFMERYCDQVYHESDGLFPGDIVLLRDDTTILHHLVVFTEKQTIIHAWRTTGINKVVETDMLPDWWKCIHSVWHVRGVV